MRYLLYLFVAASLSGCYLNPSVMLKTPRNYRFTSFDSTLVTSVGYKIAINDVIEFRLYSNDGFRVLEMGAVGNSGVSGGGIGGSSNQNGQSQDVIDYDGYVKLPILGNVKMEGMTKREAELFLQEKYSTYYVKPFVLLKVTNKRIIVFPGNYSNASVLILSNNNTRLIEAIALAGGIAETGKSRNIKVIRGGIGPNSSPEVYKINLSSVSGLKQANMVMQANDIIYVEPRKRIASRIVSEMGPWLSLISTITLAYALVKK